jgi:hypothetical protein
MGIILLLIFLLLIVAVLFIKTISFALRFLIILGLAVFFFNFING